MTELEMQKAVIIIRALQEKPVVLAQLLAFLSNKPLVGSIRISVRDGKVNASEEIRQTY